MIKEKSLHPVRVLLIDGNPKHFEAAKAYTQTDSRIRLSGISTWAEGGADAISESGLTSSLWGAAIISVPFKGVFDSTEEIIENLRTTKTPYVVFDSRNPNVSVTYSLDVLIDIARNAPCNKGLSFGPRTLPISTTSVPVILGASGPKTEPENWKSCIDALFTFYSRTSYNDKINPAWLHEYAAGRDQLRTLRESLNEQYRRAGGEPKIVEER